MCCDDPDEYADALECIVGPNGILLSPSGSLGRLAPDLSELINIHAIVICNVGFSHLGVIDTTKVRLIYKEKISEFRNGVTGWRYNANVPVGVYINYEKSKSDILFNNFVKAFELLNGMRKDGSSTQDFSFHIFNAIQSIILLNNKF